MGTARSTKGSERQGLPDLCAESLMLIQQLRIAGTIDDGSRLRSKILDVLGRMERGARESAIEHEEVQNAKFALVAFLDEAITGLSFADKEQWIANPLQLELFHLNSAGEEFFRRLAELRQRPQQNTQVLEVYYLCMVLGFKGRYLYDNPEGLRRLVEDTKADIHRAKGTTALQSISPHGRPGEKLAEVVTRDIPGWVIAVSVIAIGFFLFLVLTFVINGSADTVKSFIATVG